MKLAAAELKNSTPTKHHSKVSKISNLNSTQLATQELSKLAASILKKESEKQLLDNISSGPKKRNNNLQKLSNSPFLSSSLTLDSLLKPTEAKDSSVLHSKSAEFSPMGSSTWGLKVNAANVLGGRVSQNVDISHIVSPVKDQINTKNETSVREKIDILQDWSSRHIRSKYRDEHNRERKWRTWLAATRVARDKFDVLNSVVPVAKVDRHPVCRLHKLLTDKESVKARIDTLRRLRMKRFSLDVQEMWLSNIHHLVEHRTATSSSCALSLPTSSIHDAMISSIDEEQSFRSPDSVLGSGLSGRRDVEGIKSMEYQIQSVSQPRAMEKIFYTTIMREPKVALDYTVRDAPRPLPQGPPPPVLERVLERFLLYAFPDASALTELSLDVHRLVPFVTPNDAGIEILWRFSIFNSSDASVTTFVCSETSLANFVLSSLASSSSSPALSCYPVGIVYHPSDILSVSLREPLHGRSSLDCKVTVSLSTKSQFSFDRVAAEDPIAMFIATAIEAEISVELFSVNDTFSMRDYDDKTSSDDASSQKSVEVSMLISISELQHLLYGHYSPSSSLSFDSSLSSSQLIHAPLHDLQWWSSPDRATDFWPHVCKQLRLSVELASPATASAREYCEGNGTDTQPSRFTQLALSLQPSTQPLEGREVTGLDLKNMGNAFAEIEDMCGPLEEDFGDSVSNSSYVKVGGLSLSQAKACMHELLPFLLVSQSAIISSSAVVSAADRMHLTIATIYNNNNNSSNNNKNIVTSVDLHRLESSSSELSTLNDENSWEAMSEEVQSLSRQVIAQHDNSYAAFKVPGVVESSTFGAGLSHLSPAVVLSTRPAESFLSRRGRDCWVDDEIKRNDRTRIATKLLRNTNVSSTNAILALNTVALDAPMIFPTMLAWDPLPEIPDRILSEPVNGIISGVACDFRRFLGYSSLLSKYLISPVRERLAKRISNFSTVAEEGLDYPNPLIVTTKSAGSASHRSLEFRDEHGFRRKVELTLLGTDPVLPTAVFGVTSEAVQGNETVINARNLWHAVVAVIDDLVRVRDPTDYHYIVSKLVGCGPSDVNTFSIRFRGGVFDAIASSAFGTYVDLYQTIKARRQIFARKLALDSKIEQSEIALKVKNKNEVTRIQRQLQHTLEKKLRKTAQSKNGWKRRLKTATFVEAQGDWEMYRDARSGLMFFKRAMRKDNEGDFASGVVDATANSSEGRLVVRAALSSSSGAAPSSSGRRAPASRQVDIADNGNETTGRVHCQWEVPAVWRGDPISVDTSTFPHRSSNEINAFSEGGGTDNSRVNTAASLSLSRTMSAVSSAGFEMPPAVQALIQEAKHANDPFADPPDTWVPRADSTEFIDPRTNGTFPFATFKDSCGAADKNASENVYINSIDSRLHSAEFLSRTQTAAAASTAGGSLGPGPSVDGLRSLLESSDDIIRVLARRLGIPESQLTAAASAVSYKNSNETTNDWQPPDAPRGTTSGQKHRQNVNALEKEQLWDDTNNINPCDDGSSAGEEDYDEVGHRSDGDAFSSGDDMWSDEEVEAGEAGVDALDAIMSIEASSRRTLKTPGRVNEARAARIAERQAMRRTRTMSSIATNAVKAPRNYNAQDETSNNNKDGVPTLDLQTAGGQSAEDVQAERVMAWRKLARPDISDTFVKRCTSTSTLGPPQDHSAASFNSAVVLVAVSPADACKYEPDDFQASYSTIFVPNSRKDMERALATLQRNVQREEELSKQAPTDDLLLFGEATGATTADASAIEQFNNDKLQQGPADPRAEATDKAIIAAKTGNVAQMEEALDFDVDVDAVDMYGNTLLVLAAQQGSKRMCKFLLRRGAAINAQNLRGNTVLHYCFAYANNELGEYLKGRGADDSLVNMDGMTCYEGLNSEDLKDW